MNTAKVMIGASDPAEELVQLRKRGAEGTVRLFEEHRSKLARMIVLRMDPRILGKVDVDDVLQDAFVEASRRVGDFLAAPSVPFFVWLRQITSQVLVDVHRRYLGAQMRDVSREMSLDQPGPAHPSSALLMAQLADSLTSPSQMAIRNEALKQLREALQSLHEIDREVLMLRHLEELGNNEVAAILGIDKHAASKRYVRALGRLNSAMSADQPVYSSGG